MNVTLLRQVAAVILEKPEALNMDNWVTAGSPGAPVRDPRYDCNAAACIAGWACLVSAPKEEQVFNGNDCAGRIDDQNIEMRARSLLHLTLCEADRLFMLEEWPLAHRHAYKRALGTLGFPPEGRAAAAANAAAARIEHFITTNGQE